MASTTRYVDKTTHKGILVIEPTHYAGLPRRPRKGHGAKHVDQAFVARFPELAPLVDGLKQTMKGLASVHLHHLLRLAEQYGLESFMNAAIRAQTHRRFNAHAVRRILERESPPDPDSYDSPMNGLGPALLGEVEESDLNEFAHLDRQAVTPQEKDHGNE